MNTLGSNELTGSYVPDDLSVAETVPVNGSTHGENMDGDNKHEPAFAISFDLGDTSVADAPVVAGDSMHGDADLNNLGYVLPGALGHASLSMVDSPNSGF